METKQTHDIHTTSIILNNGDLVLFCITHPSFYTKATLSVCFLHLLLDVRKGSFFLALLPNSCHTVRELTRFSRFGNQKILLQIPSLDPWSHFSFSYHPLHCAWEQNTLASSSWLVHYSSACCKNFLSLAQTADMGIFNRLAIYNKTLVSFHLWIL